MLDVIVAVGITTGVITTYALSDILIEQPVEAFVAITE